MREVLFTTGLLASVLLSAPGQAQVFIPLGGDAPRPTSMSSDGIWIGGVDRNGAFRWSASTGIETFSSVPTGDAGIAAGGSPIAFSAKNAAGKTEAVLWTPAGLRFLGILGEFPPLTGSSVNDISDDGSVVVGSTTADFAISRPFRWEPGLGMVDLGGTTPGNGQAFGVSADGQIVVGLFASGSSQGRPTAWSGGGPRYLASAMGEARAVTPDGSVVVGKVNKRAFRWTQATGAIDLGTLPEPPPTTSNALAVSDDGNTIVGVSASTSSPFSRAVVWRPGAGLVALEDLLPALGIQVRAGYPHLREATAISSDGRTLAGYAGGLGPAPIEGWVLTLPEVVSTYCTAQTNSQGCLTAIDTDGTPSASSGAGFAIGATNLVPGVKGLMFYGTSGAAATPFQGGFLCVATPTTRTSVQDSGGAAACSGSFAFDFNAYVPASGDTKLVGGAQVWAQYWSRDPASPSTTNLTDAVTFTLWP